MALSLYFEVVLSPSKRRRLATGGIEVLNGTASASICRVSLVLVMMIAVAFIVCIFIVLHTLTAMNPTPVLEVMAPTH